MKLTPQEMTLQIEGMVRQVTADAKTVLNLQAKARKDKDVIKLTCINDKLIQIKALQNVIDRDRSAFEGAVSDEREQHAQFADLQSNTTNVRMLREQALVCAGELEFKSDTHSSWDGPDIPDDPSKDLFPDQIEPPGYASPFN